VSRPPARSSGGGWVGRISRTRGAQWVEGRGDDVVASNREGGGAGAPPARRYPLLVRQPGGEEYIHLGNAVYDPGGGGFRSRIQFQFTMRSTF